MTAKCPAWSKGKGCLKVAVGQQKVKPGDGRDQAGVLAEGSSGV